MLNFKRSGQARASKEPHSQVTPDRKRLRIVRMGHRFHPWEDAYHLLLTLSWPKFWLAIIVGYGLANFLFAGLYLLEPEGIANAKPQSFMDAFFFSVQTMATIGYGAMYPAKPWTQILTAVEALVGLMGFSGATGLMFARFSRPTAQVRFSQSLLKTTHEGQPALLFRMANQRQNQIIEAQVSLVFIEDTVTQEGEYLRKIQDLSLVRSTSPMFALSWLVIHRIDQQSPLLGRSIESLFNSNATFVVSLTGIDDELSQTVHARHIYAIPDVLENHRFVDMLTHQPNGVICIDYRFFDQVESVAQFTPKITPEIAPKSTPN